MTRRRRGSASTPKRKRTYCVWKLRPCFGVRSPRRALFGSAAPDLATGAVALQFGFGLMTVSDTIAAISTPPGEGAIALVRISGANAIQIADKIFRGKEQPSKFASHVQHLGEIFSAENQLIDQAVLSVHRAPASYTGEDLVEISCHGGTLVSAKVLEACLRAGARAARPGEFTERAFLNGKMDLTQAEAVIDLIRARTDLALRSATEQLEGRLGDQIRNIRDELIALLAQINASIDFPEEGIEPDEGETLCARLDSMRERNCRVARDRRSGSRAARRRARRDLRCDKCWQIEFAQSSAWLRSRDCQRHTWHDTRYDRGNSQFGGCADPIARHCGLARVGKRTGA